MSELKTEPSDLSRPWWTYLNGYHWFVFAMASMAWVFDCLDQQLFILARNNALSSLLSESQKEFLYQYGDYATMIFMFGWATGGLIFGSVGDRIGRAKTLTLTVFLYSISTGLSAFSTGWLDFAFYRFVTGLGVGGVFGLAVALVADTMPDRARTPALGLLQALSALGNITAGLTSMLFAYLGRIGTIDPQNSWKYMFLVGAAPAILCVFIQLRLKEPEKWVEARRAGKLTGVKFGSYADLFSSARLRKHALMGMMLCVSGIIGVWGIGFFSPEIVKGVITQSVEAERLKGIEQPSEDQLKEIQAEVKVSADFWMGVNSIVQNVGAFIGMIFFTFLAQKLGRKPTFILGFMSALLFTVLYFQTFNGLAYIPLSALMGGCQLGLFAGYAIYLPELFPIRLRSTGTSFCYNVGRYVAALGLPIKAYLTAWFAKDAITAAEKLDAFRDAASYMCAAFIIGMVVILFLPETKGKPLPED
ncbi:MFS transporter [Pirellulaceae bacterium SH449]